MKDKTTKYPKSLERLYEDFKDYLDVIETNLGEYDKVDGKRGRYKSLLFSLRVLLGKTPSDSLIERLCNKIDYEPQLLFKGFEGFPKTNPLSQDKVLSFSEYAKDHSATLEGKVYSHRKFIWRLSSQDGAHSDDEIESNFAIGYSIYLGNIDVNARNVTCIASVILKYGKNIVKFIDEKNIIN